MIRRFALHIGVVLLIVLGWIASAAGAKDTPLIPSHEELNHDFGTMRRVLQDGEYERGIQWFQDYVDDPGELTIRLNPGYHVSVRTAALSVLQSLPAEGRKVYHRMYDQKAAALYDVASKELDAAALTEVLERYPMTTAGRRAAVLRGTISMDRSRFAEALWWWQRAAELAAGSDAEGPLVGRIAVAAHLAGRSDVAQRAAGRVKEEFADVSVRWGGRKGRLPRLVERIQSLPSRPVSKAGQGWPTANGRDVGWGWTPAVGKAKLGSLQWCHPKRFATVDENANVLKSLAGGTPIDRTYPHPSHSDWKVTISRGLIRGRFDGRGRNAKRQVVEVPPVIRPIVHNGRLIVRTDKRLIARRLSDGRELWVARVRLHRRVGGKRYGMTRLADEGWYKIACDGKRVYVMGHMLPTVSKKSTIPGRAGSIDSKFVDTSALTCVSLKDGEVLWRVGYGSKNGPVKTRMMKFHTAPLVAGGRVYALTLKRNLGQFNLTCFDPETGRLIWDRMVCQTPRGHGASSQNVHAFVSGTAPSLFAGRVVVCTNTGVIGAFDAHNGRPIWLRQYETPMIGRGGRRKLKHRRVNPVVLAGEVVVTLPYDSDRVLACDFNSGKLLWTARRRGAHRLTGLRTERVLLTGDDGWRLLRASDGKVLASNDSTPVHGKPAVTKEAAWMSAKDGRVLRLDIDSGEVSSVGRIDRGLLGNLLVVDGRLIAANAAGVCVYGLGE
jgi:outer membrane protein assembly factor BamB